LLSRFPSKEARMMTLVEPREAMSEAGPGNSDDALAERVAAALAWDLWVPYQDLRVTVRNRWVTLEGEVRSRFQRDAALTDIRRLRGVRGLADRLTIRPTPSPEVVTEAISRVLCTGAPDLRVETFPGIALLRGRVGSEGERESAERAALSVPGVGEVMNRLEVRAPSS
jgi:osmotically-inducible protein OsmY